jgi:hypothetical protein
MRLVMCSAEDRVELGDKSERGIERKDNERDGVKGIFLLAKRLNGLQEGESLHG